jgi:hypothetical protein
MRPRRRWCPPGSAAGAPAAAQTVEAFGAAAGPAGADPRRIIDVPNGWLDTLLPTPSSRATPYANG